MSGSVPGSERMAGAGTGAGAARRCRSRNGVQEREQEPERGTEAAHRFKSRNGGRSRSREPEQGRPWFFELSASTGMPRETEDRKDRTHSLAKDAKLRQGRAAASGPDCFAATTGRHFVVEKQAVLRQRRQPAIRSQRERIRVRDAQKHIAHKTQSFHGVGGFCWGRRSFYPLTKREDR